MRRFLPLPVLLAVACSSSSSEDPRQDSPSTNAPPSTELPAFDPDPCAQLRGGARGAHPLASDFGRAHALVRYFGPEANGSVSDRKLAEVLEANAPGTKEAITAYAPGVSGACAAAASDVALGTASIVMKDGVAVVTPGTGDLGAIPGDAKAIALDVRALGEGDDAHAALDRALAAILTGDVAPLAIEERTCSGQPDEVWSVLV